MSLARVSAPSCSRAAQCLRLALLVLVAAAAVFTPAGADTNSARYKFEGNKWLALDLAIGDVRADTIRFEWPATLMRVKTGYKANVNVVNGSSRQASIGIAVAIYDQESRLIGAGTAGTTLGTIDPGETTQFTVDFKDVTGRIEQADQFHIALETK